jgi:hypothetical protein
MMFIFKILLHEYISVQYWGCTIYAHKYKNSLNRLPEALAINVTSH